MKSDWINYFWRTFTSQTHLFSLAPVRLSSGLSVILVEGQPPIDQIILISSITKSRVQLRRQRHFRWYLQNKRATSSCRIPILRIVLYFCFVLFCVFAGFPESSAITMCFHTYLTYCVLRRSFKVLVTQTTFFCCCSRFHAMLKAPQAFWGDCDGLQVESGQ